MVEVQFYNLEMSLVTKIYPYLYQELEPERRYSEYYANTLHLLTRGKFEILQFFFLFLFWGVHLEWVVVRTVGKDQIHPSTVTH